MKKFLIITLISILSLGLCLVILLLFEPREIDVVKRENETIDLIDAGGNSSFSGQSDYKISGNNEVIDNNGKSVLQLKTAVARNAFNSTCVGDINRFYQNATKSLATKKANGVNNLTIYQPIKNELGQVLYIRFDFEYETKKTSDIFYYNVYGKYLGNDEEYEESYDLCYSSYAAQTEGDILADLYNSLSIDYNTYNTYESVESDYFDCPGIPGYYDLKIKLEHGGEITKIIKVRDYDIVTSTFNSLSKTKVIEMLKEANIIQDETQIKSVESDYFFDKNKSVPGKYAIEIQLKNSEKIKSCIKVADATEDYDVNSYPANLFSTELKTIDVDVVTNLDTAKHTEDKMDVCNIANGLLELKNENTIIQGNTVSYVHSGGFAYINYTNHKNEKMYVKCEELWTDPTQRLDKYGPNYKVWVEALYTELFEINQRQVDDESATLFSAQEKGLLALVNADYASNVNYDKDYGNNPVYDVITTSSGWPSREANLDNMGKVQYEESDADPSILIFYINYKNSDTLKDNHLYLVYHIDPSATTDSEMIQYIELYVLNSSTYQKILSCDGTTVTYEFGYSQEYLNFGNCREYDEMTYLTLNKDNMFNTMVEEGESDIPSRLFTMIFRYEEA